MSSAKRRDREQTCDALVQAVGDTLVQHGFAKTNATAVARTASVDKALIYRYFGDFPQLLQSFTDQHEIWWAVDDMLAAGPADTPADDLAAWLKLIFERHIDFLRHHPVTLEIIAWEMADRNALTEALEYVRDQRSLELMKQLLLRSGRTDRQDMVHFGSVMALLSASANYLAARARHADNFSGLDLKSDRGWQQLIETMETMIRSLVSQRTNPSKPAA